MARSILFTVKHAREERKNLTAKDSLFPSIDSPSVESVVDEENI